MIHTHTLITHNKIRCFKHHNSVVGTLCLCLEKNSFGDGTTSRSVFSVLVRLPSLEDLVGSHLCLPYDTEDVVEGGWDGRGRRRGGGVGDRVWCPSPTERKGVHRLSPVDHHCHGCPFDSVSYPFSPKTLTWETTLLSSHESKRTNGSEGGRRRHTPTTLVGTGPLSLSLGYPSRSSSTSVVSETVGTYPLRSGQDQPVPTSIPDRVTKGFRTSFVTTLVP